MSISLEILNAYLKINITKKLIHVHSQLLFFERQGNIDGIEYKFHGTGCTAQKDGVIYAYDISLFEKDIIQFSQWELTEFIRTHPDYQKLNYAFDYVEYELYLLINKGILEWLTIEGIEGTPFGCVFKTYRVIQDCVPTSYTLL